MSKLSLSELQYGKLYRGMSYYGERTVNNIIIKFKGTLCPGSTTGVATFVLDELANSSMQHRIYGALDITYSEVVPYSTTWEKYYAAVDKFIASGTPYESTISSQQIDHFSIF